AELRRAETQMLLDPEGKTEAAVREVERLIPTFTERGDDGVLAAANNLRAQVHWMHAKFGPARQDLLQAAAHSRAAGDRLFEAAERHLRLGYDRLTEMEDLGHLSTWAGYLARTCWALHRYEQAERYADECRRLSASDDILNQWLWRGVHAKALAGRHEFAEAERLAGEGVEFMGRTDDIWREGEALSDLAEVLALAEKKGEAESAYGRAPETLERKGIATANDAT